MLQTIENRYKIQEPTKWQNIPHLSYRVFHYATYTVCG